MKVVVSWTVLLLCFFGGVVAAEPDIVIADFEGKALVNTFFHGDGTQGTLTSPEFKIERKYVNFLIGGGSHPGQTCINLLVDGKVVRTATGPNRRPGGTERLDPCTWDVGELAGKMARIEIVDKATDGWGHINVDHIVQSDRRAGVVSVVKDITIEKDYLQFCIPAGRSPRTSISLSIGGDAVRSHAGNTSDKDTWISWKVAKLKGKAGQVKIQELPAADGSGPLQQSVAQSDEAKGAVIVVDEPYNETYRPQFHFTPRKNWTNDPNGLVYYKGEYHLFFQHNPFGIRWGNMTWGHAVSPDLVHWKQLDHAIHPDKLGTIFSGSAVVDANNTAGFQTGDEKVIVCIYTSAGRPFTQSIAYSNDRGRTWTKYAKNPVLGHIAGSNRDPKVSWYEPIKKWVMALFLDRGQYALFTSPNLKEWERLCDIPPLGSGECPDFFQLPVDGNPNNQKRVFWGGNGNYLIGGFDGKTFAKESGPHRSKYGANDYAAQTYSNIPESDGRRIQISWMSGGKYPNMPFNQQMSFPRVLTLRTTDEGVRLFMEPVKEIALLHEKEHAFSGLTLQPNENPLKDISGDLFHIVAEFEPGKATAFGFDIRGHKVQYSVAKKTITSLGKTAPLAVEDGKVKLELLVDRTSIELFGNAGRIQMATCFLPDPANRSIGVFAEGGEAKIVSLKVYELKSAWAK